MKRHLHFSQSLRLSAVSPLGALSATHSLGAIMILELYRLLRSCLPVV